VAGLVCRGTRESNPTDAAVRTVRTRKPEGRAVGQQTGIEWTDATWNPVVGCRKVSEGCRHCYAKTLHDLRHAASKAGKRVPLQYARPFEDVQVMPDRLEDPHHWRKPRRVFVNSVSDLFHEDVPDDFLARVFGVMRSEPRHTFQVLTKRPARMLDFLTRCRLCEHDWITHDGTNPTAFGGTGVIVGDPGTWPLPNVWLGVSVEDQQRADERIPHLLRTPAAVRFLSCEPLLGPVDLGQGIEPVHADDCLNCGWDGERFIDKEKYEFTSRGDLICPECGYASGMTSAKASDESAGIDWVIAGGESGTGARPMHPDWVRSLRDQCQAAGVAFFFKQWGEFIPADWDRGGPTGSFPVSLSDFQEVNGYRCVRVGKKAAGRQLDGREWSEFPATPASTK
jgi:protein gp37